MVGENSGYITNCPIIIHKFSCLGCKGSLVQIQSRRPISPYRFAKLLTTIHKSLKSVICSCTHSYAQIVRCGRGKFGNSIRSSLLSFFSDAYFKILTQKSKKSKTGLCGGVDGHAMPLAGKSPRGVADCKALPNRTPAGIKAYPHFIYLWKETRHLRGLGLGSRLSGELARAGLLTT